MHIKNTFFAIIFMLFIAGCTASSSLTSDFEQQKDNSSSQKIEEVHWRLTALLGKTLVLDEAQRKPYIRLKRDNNRLQGFGGCNFLTGSYVLKEGMRIRFSQMASTMMACPSLDDEQALFRILEEVDSYSLKDGILTLNKARMAPLAIFEAVASP